MPSTSTDALEALLPSGNTADGHVNGEAKNVKRKMMTAMQEPKPSSLLFAVLLIGLSCGTVAFIYSSTLNYFLILTWDVVPNRVVMPLWHSAAAHISWWPEKGWVLGSYVLFISTLFGLVVGGSQKLLGSPGDLPETIGSFHKDGFVPHTQVYVRLPLMNAHACDTCMCHMHVTTYWIPPH